jgi:hypothetical protein
LHVTFVKTGPVGVFQPQDKRASPRAGKEVIEKGGPQAADVLQSGGGWGVAISNFHGIYYILIVEDKQGKGNEKPGQVMCHPM